MSTPFSYIPEQREKQIRGLMELFGTPIWITRNKNLALFKSEHHLSLYTIEALLSEGDEITTFKVPSLLQLAIFMLTSGSTGTAKAVCLRQSQVITALEGKASVRKLTKDSPFLNWIGLDHVASLVEIHLQAIFLGLDQIHVDSSDIVPNPAKFLILLSQHKASRSFAPNFFLAKIRSILTVQANSAWRSNLDLSCLGFLASGGEPNDVETCEVVSRELISHGASPDVIVTGFGMTETCAGAIFNLQCHQQDIPDGRKFTCLGHCMPGIAMRVSLPVADGSFISAEANEIGNLELQGPVVFAEYYNNSRATAEAFTADKWFKTGDQAMIDQHGNLHLKGRSQDRININGVKYLPDEVETVLNENFGPELSRVICFPYRPVNQVTESICISYVLGQDTNDFGVWTGIYNKVVRIVMLHTGVRPFILALSDESLLPRSTLWKISRQKVRRKFEAGGFADQIHATESVILKCRTENLGSPANDLENLLLEEMQDTFDIVSDTFGVDCSLFEIRITSIDLMRLKKRIGIRLQLQFKVPVVLLMQNQTVRLLAKALGEVIMMKEYNPIVVLRSEGSKPPLWLVHPGVGEVLVFLGLAQHMNDRPIFDLRVRGFDGEPPFNNLREILSIYYNAIKSRQPNGPYAIAGYSYGTMLAFELTKCWNRIQAKKYFSLVHSISPRISKNV
ncbi:hypothetical protein BOTCAL_0242g00120 [Botryotinia calthae]|uniref:Carrier domain-containing protein n=1 Tax=Botryotinia calthae TaxID=38488 RepID=A0A4Y8CZK3_9HELO|nr:hypothetical protein BOTCAL_0242g00120 [Botryotinia calthae]